MVGQDPVAPGLLDRRGERPGPGQLGLEDPGVVLGPLLDRVEVLRQQRAGPSQVDAGSVGQPPPGRLEVGTELGDHRQRPAGHVRDRAPSGQLRHVRQLGQLAEHDAQRFGVLPGVVGLRAERLAAGHGPDAGGQRHAGPASTDTRDVAVIVADPTTRVPS